MDIVDFITARLAEDEAVARATTPVPVDGQWHPVRDKHADDDAPLTLVQGADPYAGEEWNQADPGHYNYGLPVIVLSAEWQAEAEANLRYIARWDPARVLAEVAAKRAIISLHHRMNPGHCLRCYELIGPKNTNERYPCKTLRAVAAPYADHPDYDPSWRIDA